MSGGVPAGELLPCPFCGGRAQLDRYDPDPENPEMAVNCMGECYGIFIFPKIAAGDFATLAQRWNTRATPTPPIEGRDADVERARITLDVFLAGYDGEADDKLVNRGHSDDLLTWGDLRTILAVIQTGATHD